MRRMFHTLPMAVIAMAAASETGSAPATDEAPAKESKSIVPAKYNKKYKNGGSDVLADFINEQCKGKDGFEYTAFFDLCRKNELPEDKIAHYEGLIAEKAHGAQGRTRMTLRNMLATKARKDGSLNNLSGVAVPLDLPKPAVSGAAAAAKEQASEAADDTSTGTGETTE